MRKVTGRNAAMCLGALVAAVLVVRGIAADSGEHWEQAEEGTGFERDGEIKEDFSGTLLLAGSSSMEEPVNTMAESFMEKYPDVTVLVQFTGSSAGIEAVLAGSADIGNASRYLTEDEMAQGAVENLIGLDGIAICVDGDNPVSNLTGKQLQDIYAGKIRNWSELGGEDIPVVVLGREAGSGTRKAFEEYLGLEDACTYGNELDSAGAVLARISATPGAIGYVSLAAAGNRHGNGANFPEEKGSSGSVRILSLDGIYPSREQVRKGSYPLYQPFLMVTKGEISAGNRLVQAWFTYVYSEAGREALEHAGSIGYRGA